MNQFFHLIVFGGSHRGKNLKWKWLGPSGAGKTTLIRVLTGQLRFEEGDAIVMGKRVTQLTGSDKKQFGVMMDDFGLYERLSCYQNLRVFADIYGASDAEIRKVLSEVKLQDAEKKEVSKLSKGMKERLRLARALLSRPKVLFLDEPTSGGGDYPRPAERGR